MGIALKTPEDIGNLVRAARQAENLRQDDAAGAIGVSDVFLWKLEKGGPGVRLDKLLQVFKAMGIQLSAEVSDNTVLCYQKLLERKASSKRSGVKKPRANQR